MSETKGYHEFINPFYELRVTGGVYDATLYRGNQGRALWIRILTGYIYDIRR